jgi:hypothetical protein
MIAPVKRIRGIMLHEDSLFILSEDGTIFRLWFDSPTCPSIEWLEDKYVPCTVTTFFVERGLLHGNSAG